MNQTNSSLKVACPTCSQKKPYPGNPARPFCSERCRLIDLGEWASESYRVAGSSEPFSEELLKAAGQSDNQSDTNDFGDS